MQNQRDQIVTGERERDRVGWWYAVRVRQMQKPCTFASEFRHVTLNQPSATRGRPGDWMRDGAQAIAERIVDDEQSLEIGSRRHTFDLKRTGQLRESRRQTAHVAPNAPQRRDGFQRS